MDTDELARIEETLLQAIGEARAIAKEYGVSPQFREVVRHAREIHDLLLDALRIGGSHATQRTWGLCIALGNAVDELELLDFLVVVGPFW